MKFVCAQIAFSFLVAMTCARLAIAQDEIQNIPLATTTYTYTAVNAPGASATLAYAINNSGEIVGYITGGQCAVISDQAECGFIDKGGKFTYVACELENGTEFFDVSNAGEVVGTYSFFGGVHGFIWQGNQSCFDLVDPNGQGGAFTEAWGVVGQAVVGFYVNSATDFEGFQYSGTTQEYKNISCPGWANTRAYGINAAGLIVGDVSTGTANAPGPFHGMLYDDGKCTIFNFPKAVSTSAKGINKTGQISGWYTDSAGVFHGFIKTGSTFTAINFPKAPTTQAYHLNDQGQIAGSYTDTAGATHGFIASPSTASVSEDAPSEPSENQ